MGIEVKNLCKSFGDTKALSEVNLNIESGVIYGLLGNNGAGKTTLLSIINNRIFADSGTVKIDGEDACENDAAQSKLYMMSEQNLYPDDMRVKAALKVSSELHPNFDADYALSLCDKFALPTKKKITALSTGYESIFKLIVALSVNTPYVLFDEPVLGLDAQHRDMFYRLLLEKYTSEPFTPIISTHIISEVENIIERAVIMRNGRILRDAPCDELTESCYCVSGVASSVDQYTKELPIISVLSIGSLKSVSVNGKMPSERPSGLEFGRISLQDYFIQLMNEEDKNEVQ